MQAGTIGGSYVKAIAQQLNGQGTAERPGAAQDGGHRIQRKTGSASTAFDAADSVFSNVNVQGWVRKTNSQSSVNDEGIERDGKPSADSVLRRCVRDASSLASSDSLFRDKLPSETSRTVASASGDSTLKRAMSAHVLGTLDPSTLKQKYPLRKAISAEGHLDCLVTLEDPSPLQPKTENDKRLFNALNTQLLIHRASHQPLEGPPKGKKRIFSLRQGLRTARERFGNAFRALGFTSFGNRLIPKAKGEPRNAASARHDAIVEDAIERRLALDARLAHSQRELDRAGARVQRIEDKIERLCSAQRAQGETDGDRSVDLLSPEQR